MRYILFAFLGLLIWPSLKAQDLSYYFPGQSSYNPEIPAPADFLGYEVGEWHVSHDQLAFYMKTLAEKSDRVALVEIGKTHEGRPLLHLIITAPENHARLESIREEHLKLTDPSQSRGLDLASMPGVIWMGYSIHGNEASGSNASLLVAYHLAAAEGPEIDQLLAEMVILLDPAFNPDGLHRFSTWVNMHRGTGSLVADPMSREHQEAWPGGRTNHYWFDLNRDWLTVQHPESRARIAQFHRWKPMFLTDHHEMGTNSTFFFQPGVPSRNHPLTPDRVFELTNQMAPYHAQALDEIGSLYYTKEGFDDFFYGKGSTYPDINGGVGILFEQASSRGHLQESIHGDLAFPFTIRNQVRTSLSTLKGTHELREEMLAHQRDFFIEARAEAEAKRQKGYVFHAPKDPVRAHHFLSLLLAHKIEVYHLSGDYRDAGGKVYPAEAGFFIPLAQNQYRLIQAMFERRTSFTDSLFYDVSAWTLPLAFNLQYAAVNTIPGGALGEPVTEAVFPKGGIKGGESPYAYVLAWENYHAPKALYQILALGLRAKVATQAFTGSGDQVHAPGSILIPVQGQSLSPSELHAELNRIAEAMGVQIYNLLTGLNESGVDLGSNAFEPLRIPKIALLVGEGVSSYEAGEVWHLLDHRFEMPVTLVDVADLGRLDLHTYTTLIMVNGNYGRISPGQRDRIMEWVTEGGNLIAQKSALRWIDANNFLSLSFKSREEKQDTMEVIPFGDRSKVAGAKVIGGSIFEARMDLTHPIAYGYTDPVIPVFRNSTMFLNPTGLSYANPVMYTDQPLLSGYMNRVHAPVVSGSAVVQSGRLGRGTVVAFVDNPNFRAFWLGTQRLFLNSLFFGSNM